MPDSKSGSQSDSKIFITGLPRTATTSTCLALLEMGFKTAHTAYTNQCFEQAQVIADTPVFAEYPQLDQAYPGSKFIYLERNLDTWLPSIRQLLERMLSNLNKTDGGFNPHIKRCYQSVFQPLSAENIASDAFLISCYKRHQQQLLQYFSNRPADFLRLDISHTDSFGQLIHFLDLPTGNIQAEILKHTSFEHTNKGGKVTFWNQVRHPLKVESTRHGRIDSVLNHQS